MIQLAWVAFFICFSTLCTGESTEGLPQSLDNLCVDNTCTQSWWTYSLCFNRSVMQVHVDARTKQLREKVYLGEFVPEESTEQRHIYRTAEAEKSCSSVDASGSQVLLHRTSAVQFRCCEDIVHLRRQSRHTHLPTIGIQESSLSHYWGPELAAAQAVEELQSRQSKRTSSTTEDAGKAGNLGGYGGASSTATELAYIHSVEEPSPCNYEIHVCSELICTHSPNEVRSGSQYAGKQAPRVKNTAVKHQSTKELKDDNPNSPTTSTSTSTSSSTSNSNINSKTTSTLPSSGPSTRAAATVSTNRETSKPVFVKSTADVTESDPTTTSASASASVSISVAADPLIDSSAATSAISARYVTPAEQKELKERSRQMFYHAYDSYMHNAFPEAELLPISCTGGKFDLIKIPLVTLIDTLDTLVILGNYSEFRRAVNIITTDLPSFNLDVNVSVFETTIRVLGGLLSAHLMAIDPKLNIYDQHTYDGRLLTLSLDLGERLLPAFETKTSIPYGTVNLRYGVPRGETKIASTAGAGSLLLEFQVLSHLTGQHRFGTAAYLAMRGLYDRKSPLGLLGKHIHTETGQWSESLSGVGSNADSFYEYLLKAYLLFRDKELYGMFSDTYRAIKQFVMPHEHWFTEVDMFSGKLQRKRLENLDAFWPGVEAMLGFSHYGAGQLNTFFSIWQDLGFLPEEIDYFQWQTGKGAVNGLYPLRPELIESTYHQYRTTNDRSWLSAGKVFLESIEQYTRTDCGYASVLDVSTMKLTDSMPSFFLSETCKYLYLLFDDDNFVNHRPYIFSTEAHPFDALQVHFGDLRSNEQEAEMDEGITNKNNESGAAEAVQEPSTGPSEKVKDSLKTNELAVTKANSNALVPTETSPTENTEAPLQERKIKKKKGNRASLTSPNSPTTILDEVRRHHQTLLEGLKSGSLLKVLSPDQTKALSKHVDQSLDQAQLQAQLQRMFALPPVAVSGPSIEPPQHYLPMKCRKPQWWDKSTSYDAEYLQVQNSQLRKETVREKASYQRKQRSTATAHADKNKNKQKDKDKETPRAGLSKAAAPLRVQNRLNPQAVAHFAFLLLDLAQQVHVWERAPHPTPFPHITKLKWLERPSPLFKNEKCLPEDQPSKKGSKKDPNAPPTSTAEGASPKSQNGAEPIKSVRIEMPALGTFSIHVYTDGFLIHNENDDILVEISNIGRALVLLRENTHSSSQTEQNSKILMANVDHHSVNSCRVQIVQTSENAFSEKTIFDRACSVANFGPTLSTGGASFSAGSVIYDPNDLLCAPPKVISEAAAALSAALIATKAPPMEPSVEPPVVPTAAVLTTDALSDSPSSPPSQSSQISVSSSSNTNQQAEQTSGSKWWQWSLLQFLTGETSILSNFPSSTSSTSSSTGAFGQHSPIRSTTDGTLGVRGKLALVDRGDCLFEDKANNALLLGAQGLIVRNSEDTVFIMAGKRDVEVEIGTTKPSESSTSPLPVTVMLTKTDGVAFEQTVRETLLPFTSSTPHQQGDQETALSDRYTTSYHIVASVDNMILHSTLMGDFSYPKLFMHRKSIFVLGSGRWATLLRATQGKTEDWQLYLMSLEDVYSTHLALVPSNQVRSKNGQRKSMPHTILQDPSALFWHTYMRKCPGIIRVAENNLVYLS